MLAEGERDAFARALSDRAGQFEERYGFHPEGGVLDMAVQRMIDQGTDEEEAVRFFSGLFAGVERFRSSFREKHSLNIEFTAEARDRLLEIAAVEGDAEALCRRLFANYPLGLQLLHEKRGKESFELDRDAVEEPDAHLDRMIKENYEV